MQYTPNSYSGTRYTEVLSELIHANDTIGKNFVRVIDGIKYKTSIPSISGGITLQPYAEVMPQGVSVNDTIKLSDAVLMPEKFTAYTTFTMNSLRETYFSESMAKGAAQMDSDPFLNMVIAQSQGKVGEEVEKKIWDGFSTVLTAATDVKKTTGPALTAANLKAEFIKLYGDIDKNVIRSKEAVIFADLEIYQLLQLANVNEQFRDTFTVDQEGTARFLNTVIDFVPMPVAGTVMAGRRSDFIVGTDLTDDFKGIEVGKVYNNSDLLFLKAVMTLATGVAATKQKVLRKVAP